MEKQVAFSIIAECAELGVNSLKFNYRGEATLNPDFSAITELAKTLASRSTFIDRIVNSNFKFHLTRRANIFEGLAHLTKVKVSYDSFIPEVFNAQRTGGNHDTTTKNIDAFYNSPERIKSETQLVIQAVRTVANKDEDILGESRRRWPDAEVSVRDMVTGRIDKDLSKLENKTRDIKNRKTCIQAHARLIIHHDGRVAPCCPAIKNNLIIGDIHDQSVKAIFNSQKVKELRQALKYGSAFLKDPCRTCPSFESFKGYKPNWKS